MVHGFVPFAICFFLFIDVWHEHYTFFKRYGVSEARRAPAQRGGPG
jgi:hypothetical protein